MNHPTPSHTQPRIAASALIFGARCRVFLIILFALFSGVAAAQSPTVVTLTTPGTGLTWDVPAGVTNVKVEVWGGGGGGGGANGSSSDETERGGGGGGGGAYKMMNSVTVDPVADVTYNLGSGGTGDDGNGLKGGDGGTTSFASVSAGGGVGGQTATNLTVENAGDGGAGGTASGGDASFNGGAGGRVPSDDESGGGTVLDPDAGGGGGGGAGSAGAGGNATESAAGAAGNPDGGAGAEGPDSHDHGAPGSAPGGGGSGGYTNTNTDDVNRTGGNGAPGQIRITYTLPAAPSTPDLDATDDTGSLNTDNITSVTSNLTFTGTCDNNASIVIQLYNGGTPIGGATDDGSGGAWSININLAEGSHSISARATLNGNFQNSPGSVNVLVDATGPVVTLDDDQADNLVKQGDVVNITATFVEANGLAAGTPTIQIGTAQSATNMSGAGPYTYAWNVPAGNDGSHTITIVKPDVAGNIPTYVVGTGATSYVIDNTGPSVTLTDDHPDAIVRDADVVEISATFADTHGLNGTPQIAIGTAQTATPMTGSFPTWTFTWNVPAGFDGNHTVTITGVTDDLANANQTPVAGAGGETSYTIDNIAPTITAASDATPAGALKVNDEILFTVTPSLANPNLTIAPTVYNGGALVWTPQGGGTTYTATYTVIDDAFQLDQFPPLDLTGITATDLAGNTSSPASTADVEKTIDANYPAAPAATAAINGGTIVGGWYNASNDGITFTVPIDPGDATLTGGIIRVLIDNDLAAGFLQLGSDESTVPTSGNDKIFTYDGTILEVHSRFVEGETLWFRITIIDASGNETTTATLALQPTVDTTPPANPDVTDLDATTDSFGGATGSVGTNSDDKTNSTNPLINGNSESGSSVSIYTNIPFSTFLASGVASSGTFAINIGNVIEGTHTLSALAVDQAGNVSAGSGATFNFEVSRTKPTVTTRVFSDNGGGPETVIISFSEPIDIGDGQSVVIGNPGFSVNAGAIGSATFTGGALTLTSASNLQWQQQTTSWTYNDAGTTGNYIFDEFGNELADVTFSSTDGTAPFRITGIVFDPNGTGVERVSFNVSEELNLAEGQVIFGDFPTCCSGFHDTWQYRNTTYTGKGTTNTLTLESNFNGEWNESTLQSGSGSYRPYWYDGSTTIFDVSSTPNALATFSNVPALFWRVNISSNNANAAYAKTGDQITLLINSNLVLAGDPIVTFEGNAATVTPTGPNQWNATYTTTGSFPDGLVDFVITAVESGQTTLVTKTTNSSTVTFDKVVPVINPVTISSNNANSASQAKVGNTVTVLFTLSEALPASPTATIGGQVATVANLGGFNWRAQRVLTGAEPEGILAFSISLADFAGNAASANATTNASSVDLDKTVPTVNSFTRTDTDPNNTTTVNWSLVFSEAVTGVNTGDFQTFGAASGGGETVGVTGSGTTYTVTVSGVTRSGLLGVQIVDDNTIEDDADNFLGGPGVQGPFQSEQYTIFFPEPANHATAFAIDGAFTTTTQLRVTWTEGTGFPIPTGYLITVERFGGTAVVPVDGTPVANQANLVAFAQGQLNVADAAGTTNLANFSNLLSGEAYTFKIYSYTNSGSAIDYKLDGVIPMVVGNTPAGATTGIYLWSTLSGTIAATTMTSAATAPNNFQFAVWDDDWNLSVDNAGTKIETVRINRSATGPAINWFDALSEVYIKKGAVTKQGIIGATGDYIEFSGLYVPGSENFGFVGDNSNGFYDIQVVLNPSMSQSLKNTIDRESFVFHLDPEVHVTFATGSSTLYPSVDFNVQTSNGNNQVQVTADRLEFEIEPPLDPTVVYVKKTLSPSPVVRAKDVHGFTDQDYVSTLTVVSASAPISHSSLLVDAASPNAGVYTFPSGASGFQYTDDGNGLNGNGNLTVSGPSLAFDSDVASGQVNVRFSDDGLIANDNDDETAIMPSTAVATNSYMAFSFKVTEENIDGAPTQISSLKITSLNTVNEVADWSQALAGASLKAVGFAGFFNASSILADEIQFTAIPNGVAGQLGYVATNTPKIFELYIWLKPTLDGTLMTDIDGKNFGFQVLDDDIVLAGTGSTFDGSQSASANVFGARNEVDVVADRLRFIVHPDPDLLVNRDISLQLPKPVVEATDPHNRRDLDYTSSTITVTNTGTLGMSGLPTGTEFSAGIFNFPDAFRFTTIGTNVQLNVQSTGTSVVSATPNSNLFDVRVASSATITAAGGGEPAQISSLVDTDPEKVLVFNFTIHDDPDATTIPEEDDGNPTRVTDVIVNAAGANNSITNWANVIAGAYLYDGTNLSSPGIVTADQIIFNGIPNVLSTDLGHIEDGTTSTPKSKTFQLLIYLRTDIEDLEALPIDGETFSFEVDAASITTHVDGTAILPAETEDSGAANEIDVDATVLDFTSIPGPTSVSLSTDFNPAVFVEARDVNGNRDIDFTGTITAFGAIAPPTVPPVSFNYDPVAATDDFSNGTYTFPTNLQYTSDGNGENGKGTLVMTAGGISGQSASITIQSSFDSDLTFNPAGPTGPIPYIDYEEDNSDVTIGNSVELAQLTLTDGIVTGDTDGANTVLTSLTVSITNPSNLSRVALYNDANTEIAGTDQAVTGSTVVFNPGSPIVATDTQGATQGIETFTIRASFKGNATDVHDHDIIDIQITDAVLGAGSEFIVGAGFIGGVDGGSIAPSQSINVLATKIDFVTPPASYEGINQPVTEPEAHARDANDVVDLDVTGPAGSAFVSTPVAGITSAPSLFDLGVLEFPGFQYTSIGNGTLTIDAANGIGNPITGTSNQVDVVHVTTSVATGGVYQLNLGGGVKNKVIFGVTFEAAHGTATEPKLEEFTFSFDTDGAITGVLENYRVYESEDDTYQESLDQDVVLNYGAVLTAGTKSLRVQFPSPRNLSQDPSANGGRLTYFLKIDVAESANPSTPEIRPQMVDEGFGTLTDGNIVTSVGSATSINVDGISYNFASVLAPTVVSSYPASGQLNVDPTQPVLELVFSVPVWTLDRKAKLYKKRTSTFVADLDAQNGFYDPTLTSNPSNDAHKDPVNLANLVGTATTPMIFTLPVMDPNEEYYITMEPGLEQSNPPVYTGVVDEFGNLSLGFTFSEVLFFKTANPVPPALIKNASTTVTSVTAAGAVVNGVFDQQGKAFFLVVPNSEPAPNNDQIKGIAAYPGTITYRGDFDITKTNPIPQFGIVDATLPLGGQYHVWMCAESYTSKNHVDTPIPTTAPYGSANNNHGVGLAGPTLTFNGPSSSPSVVQINPPTVKMCTNSYQTMSAPIVIVEGLNNDFDTGGNVRTFNLLLPTGFQFDIETVDGTPTGAPLHGSIGVIGADFDPLVPLGPVVGKLSFINNSILKVQFANSGNSSKDKITITGLRVFATASGSGALSRLGGNAIPTVPDDAVFATLIATDAPVIGFTNSFTESEFPARPQGQEVTIIPDNYNEPAFTVQLIPEPDANDFGASSFTGPGVNVNNLNLTAVTVGVPFNITILHSDNNGCISQSPVQYTVYDHTKAIGNLAIEYCIENNNFKIGSPAPATPGIDVKTIPFNNNPATFMTTMTADLPDHAIVAGPTTQIMAGPDWRNLVQNSLLVQGAPLYPFGTPSNPDLSKPSHTYTFDVATILNANVAFPSIPDNYSHFADTTLRNNVYYTGGSLGKVEFTSNYRSVANSQAEYPLKQEVEFWVPPIPIIEVSTNVADPALSATTYCQLGANISIAGFPAASAGQSVGSFLLYDDEDNTVDSLLTVAELNGGFTDFGNGTATIDPTKLFNGYRRIRIVYSYKLNASPCGRSGSIVVRVTPNPIAKFTTTTPACDDLPVTFDGSTSDFGALTGYTINQWNWAFGDPNNFAHPNVATGVSAQHTYVASQNYTATLRVKSSFGCLSDPATATSTQTVRVGAIPVAGFSFTGLSTADQISFINSSAVPSSPAVSDNIARLDWAFGDGVSTPVTSGFGTPAAPAPGPPTPHQYGAPQHYNVDLFVTSVIGCKDTLRKEIIILDRRVITDLGSYEERFTANNGNWQVAAISGTSPASWTWGAPPTGADKKIVLDALNEGKVWMAINPSTGEYNSEENSAIYSPSLDMSDPELSRPMITLLTSRHLADGDGVVIEYSTDNLNVADPLKDWNVLIDGFVGQSTGVEWYNSEGLSSTPGQQITGYGWTGSSSSDIGWKESKHILDNVLSGDRSNVVFRVALGSQSTAPRGREGFAFDNVRIGNRTRTVLIENFSNSGTSTTARVGSADIEVELAESDSLKGFKKDALGNDEPGTKLVKIIYHTGFPRKDPFNEDNRQDPSARALYYGIKTTPRARLDGQTPNEDQLFSEWMNAEYDRQTLKLSEAQLIPTATVQNGTITVNVAVGAIIQGKSIRRDSTILHVAIVEKAIAKTALSSPMQALISTDETWFEYVLKKMLPSAVGTRITQTINFGSVVNFGPFTWEPDLNKLYLPQHDLAVVVFLQDELTRVVYQAEIIDVNDPPVVTGLEDGLRIEDVTVFPNPANDELNILLPRRAIGNVKVRLIDQMGKAAIGDTIPDGANEKKLDVVDLASGVYILQLEENGRTTYRKVMVTH